MNAYDMIYTRDMDGNNTSINAAGEKLTCYSQEEFLQLNMNQIIVPEHVALAKEKIAQKLAGNAGSSYETDILAKDGRRITLEVNTRLIFRECVQCRFHRRNYITKAGTVTDQCIDQNMMSNPPVK